MGILSGILSRSGGIAEKVAGVVDDLTTTDEERLAAERDMYEAETERLEVTQRERLAEIDAQKSRDLAQADINKEEAKSPKMFVSGWRPCIGWTCAAAVAWFYVLDPASKVVYAMATSTPFPELPGIGELMVLLANMLGFGALRTWERSKGVHNSQVSSFMELGKRRKK